MRAVHSGKFVLRIPGEIHQSLCTEAMRRKTSLNSLCLDLLAAGLKNPVGRKVEIVPERRLILRELLKKFGDRLAGLLVFGSQVRREATNTSDMDLMIILDETVPIDRSLYRWWDEALAPKLPPAYNPQFTCLPPSPQEAGGLWFEAAMAHEILWERERDASRFMEEIKKFVASGAIRRYITQGQPYWVWRDRAE